MAFRVTTEPGVEPLTATEAREACGYLDSDRDDELMLLVRAAVNVIESWEWRALITQTITLTIDKFPGTIDPLYVPRPRLQTVATLKYYDTDGVQQTWDAANYQVDATTEPGRVRPAYGVVWPSTRLYFSSAVEMVYTAGYGDDPEDVPDNTRLLLRFLVNEFFTHPSTAADYKVEELPHGIDALLRPCHDSRVLAFIR